MDRIAILEQVERYLAGKMADQERQAFEARRREDPELDQLVVGHSVFLERIERFGESRRFRAKLHEIHRELQEAGALAPRRSRLVPLWPRYRRVMGVAATIAGFTTLLIAGTASYFSRKASTAQLQQLSKKFENTERKVNALSQQVESERRNEPKEPTNTPVKSGGTGFLIDSRGLLVTNAHVVDGARALVLQNNKAQQFRAETVLVDPVSDIALIRITDDDFRPPGSLPYGLRRTGAELGEPLFTLGYPREEIVYNEGYMSARTGFNGDTLSCQIGVSANPGNSGGPVFNRNGEVIGIVNTRQTRAEGVVFAIHAGNIFKTVDSLKKDSTLANIRLPERSSVKGLDRVQQVKRISDFVYMVKSY